MNKARRAITTAFVLLTGACETKSNVAVVQSVSWTVDSLEHMRILGIYGADSLNPLGDVVGAAKLPDGGFVVADASTSELEFFNAEGEFQRSVGGKGRGPSEFGRMVSMLHCGDSLFVRDLELNAYKVFSTDGKIARKSSLPALSTDKPAMQSVCNAGGTFLSNGWESRADLPEQSQLVRRNVPFWLSNSVGVTLANLGEHSGMDRWFTPGQNGGGGLSGLPLGRRTLIALGMERAYIGTADSFAIDVYALDGKPSGQILKVQSVQRTTPADIERYKLRDTLGLSPQTVDMHVREWSAIEFAKTLPAYTALVVDSAQNLWVRAQPPATGWLVDWFIFAPDGKEIAHTSIPQTFRVFEIGSDWVLGVDVDATTGASVVKAHTLRREP